MTRKVAPSAEDTDFPVPGPHAISEDRCSVATGDGHFLGTTVYRPADLADAPTVLMRTPYGRDALHDEAVFWASHGYNAVLQDTRSTTSYFFEGDDGVTTTEWIESQTWFNGRLVLTGASYLGFTALAIASRRPEAISAMAIAVYSSDRVSAWYPGGALSQDLTMAWSAQQEWTDAPRTAETTTVPEEILRHLPLGTADLAFAGHEFPFYRERLTYPPHSLHWKPLDFSSVLESAGIPTLLIDGWYDYHRPFMLEDFERLGRAGTHRRWVIGPWTHFSIPPSIMAEEKLAWFDLHARDGARRIDGGGAGMDEARVQLTPWGREIHLAAWPPDTDTWSLTPVANHALLVSRSDQNDGSDPIAEELQEGLATFTYDPADPTPAVGLSAFGDPETTGSVDNTNLESRADVVVFTTEPLQSDVTCIGRVTAELDVTSSGSFNDFFVRICDVTTEDRSLNIIHGLVRREGPAMERSIVSVDLGPIGHTFLKGHCIRVQISGGAHPFYDRNLGKGQDWLTGTEMTACTHQLHLGPGSMSRISLPTWAPEHEGDAEGRRSTGSEGSL